MRHRPVALLAATALVLALPGSASAATFVVTKQADTNVACVPGDCSLREAVNAANAASGGDKVVVPAGTYTLTGAAGEDLGASGDLDVTDSSDDLVLVGAGDGAGGTTIDGNDIDRVFDVVPFARFELRGVRVIDGAEIGAALRNTEGRVEIRDSTLSSNSSPNDGGAIYNDGPNNPRVTIEDSVLSGNTAGDDGAGVYSQGAGRVVISNSRLTGNQAAGRGGAMFNQNESSFTITASTISGNGATEEGGGLANQNDSALTVAGSTISGNTSNDHGGGIWAQNSSLLTVLGSTISGNRALGVDANDGGGGIWAQNDAVLHLGSSTISGNTSAFHGGALYVRNDSVLTTLNTTIAGNRASANGGAIFSEQQAVTRLSSTTVAGNAAAAGGGLFDATTNRPDAFGLESTIVSGNAAGGAAANCDGTVAGGVFTSFGNNLASTAQCDLGAAGDIPSGNAALGPLAANGGPTRTMALGSRSQARDRGGADCPSTDQRGVARPLGARCDIGAFEASPLVASIPRPRPTRAPDRTDPLMSRLRVSPRSFRSGRGADVSYRLSEDARVRFRVERRTTGRKVGRRCVKRTRRNRSRRRCRRFVRVRGSFSHRGSRGANTFAFAGRVRGRALRPGRYRLVAVATDSAGNRSKPKRASMRVRRRRR